MRIRFPGYYEPTQAEFDKIWTTGLIVPDTNILLHLLRYREDTRKQVLETLRAFAPRVWIPYQVGLEFLRGWRSVDTSNRDAYSKMKEEIQKKGADLSGIFDKAIRHQLIEAEREKEKIKNFIDEICKSLNDLSKNHPTVKDAERIVKEVSDLIGESVGLKPTISQLEHYVSEGKRRYDNQIPPGYADAKDKSDEDRYGDFIIWEQMITEAQNRSTPVIFISDDRKKDWVYRHNGHDIGPLPQLVEEFYSKTNQVFYNYPLIVFLRRAKKYTNVKLTDNAFTEIEEDAKIQKRIHEDVIRNSRKRITNYHNELDSLKSRYAVLVYEYKEFLKTSNNSEKLSDSEIRDIAENYQMAIGRLESDIHSVNEIINAEALENSSHFIGRNPDGRRFMESRRTEDNRRFRLSTFPISQTKDQNLNYHDIASRIPEDDDR